MYSGRTVEAFGSYVNLKYFFSNLVQVPLKIILIKYLKNLP